MAASTPSSRESYQILSPRLVIRTAVATDAESLQKFMTTPENFPHNPCNTAMTVEKLQTSIGRWHDMQREGINAFLVITLRETGELIGQGSYNCFERTADDDAGEEKAEEDEAGRHATRPLLTDFGVMLDHRHWRRGLGAEAVCSLVEFAARDLGCGVFRTETDEGNEPWRALLRGVGLAGFESFGPQSYDESVSGWVWKFDAEDWERVRADLKEKGKWPL